MVRRPGLYKITVSYSEPPKFSVQPKDAAGFMSLENAEYVPPAVVLPPTYTQLDQRSWSTTLTAKIRNPMARVRCMARNILPV